MPVAMGCSDFCSNEDAKRMISFSAKSLLSDTIFDTANFPIVSVPVLSKTTVVIFLEFSNAILLLINNPCLADNAVDLATTNGTANPKACGQQITITVTILSIANDKGCPAKFQ